MRGFVFQDRQLLEDRLGIYRLVGGDELFPLHHFFSFLHLLNSLLTQPMSFLTFTLPRLTPNSLRGSEQEAVWVSLPDQLTLASRSTHHDWKNANIYRLCYDALLHTSSTLQGQLKVYSFCMGTSTSGHSEGLSSTSVHVLPLV